MKTPLMPQTYGELERWAARVASTDFVPKAYRGKPNDVLICAQYAQEIGLGIVEGMRSIAVINGKPSVYGDGLLALCYSSSVCEYVKEHPILDDLGNITGYICEAKRKGQDAKMARFTIDDAKRARLWEKKGHGGQDTPWITYPQRMLQMRARGFALRDAFPDVLKGLITREEADDYPPEATAEVVIDQPPMITPEQVDQINKLIAELELTAEQQTNLLAGVQATTVPGIAPHQVHRVINTLNARKKRKEEELANGEG